MDVYVEEYLLNMVFSVSEFKMTTAPAKTFHDNLCQILMNDNQLRDFAFHSTMVSSDYQVYTALFCEYVVQELLSNKVTNTCLRNY